MRTATRVFARMVDAGLLTGKGAMTGRYYVAGNQLQDVRRIARAARVPLDDPYPGLPVQPTQG